MRNKVNKNSGFNYNLFVLVIIIFFKTGIPNSVE